MANPVYFLTEDWRFIGYFAHSEILRHLSHFIRLSVWFVFYFRLISNFSGLGYWILFYNEYFEPLMPPICTFADHFFTFCLFAELNMFFCQLKWKFLYLLNRPWNEIRLNKIVRNNEDFFVLIWNSFKVCVCCVFLCFLC